MTPKKVPASAATDPWQRFRDNARDHLRDAEQKLVLLEEGANAKGVAADAVLAAIGFADAITVQRLGKHDTKDHGRLPDLVAQALGKAADVQQLVRLGRIVKRKSEAQYGGTIWARADAEEYLKQVQRFRTWAEQVLVERG